MIRAALDLGVNVIDRTAAACGTEGVVGQALRGEARDKVVVCTKVSRQSGEKQFTPEWAVRSLDNSLRTLGLDYVDVFQLHAVPPATYEHSRDVIVPVLLREKAKGKFRHLGITETAPNDINQDMLYRAARDPQWDTAMIAFHMMHQVSRERVFPATRANGVGTLMMFAVRSIFARSAHLAGTMRELAAAGQVPAELGESDDPLGFLVHEGGASSVTDAAYRYVRHEPGVDVVLFGSGDQTHLRANIDSILAAPLPDADRARLAALFGHLRGIGLDLPNRPRAGGAP